MKKNTTYYKNLYFREFFVLNSILFGLKLLCTIVISIFNADWLSNRENPLFFFKWIWFARTIQFPFHHTDNLTVVSSIFPSLYSFFHITKRESIQYIVYPKNKNKNLIWKEILTLSTQSRNQWINYYLLYSCKYFFEL